MSITLRVSFCFLALSLTCACPLLSQSQVVAELSIYDELADALLAARTDEERAALLAAKSELVTTELTRALGRSSERLRREKRYESALTAARLALKLAEQLCYRPGHGEAWELIGRVYAAQRDYRRAIEYHSKSLAVFEELGDKSSAARLLGRIAAGHVLLDNYQASLERNLRRLAYLEELNEKSRLASALDDTTITHYRLGNFQEALATGGRAIQLYEEQGESGEVGRVLITIGAVRLGQSDYDQAIETFEKAAAIWARYNDQTALGLTTLNIGEACAGQGDYGRALDSYQKALAIFTAKKDHARMAQTLCNIGAAYSDQADQEKAREYYRQALSLYEQSGRPFGRADALSAIGATYHRQGDNGRALDYLRQGLKLLEETGRKPGIAHALANIGELYFNQGDENLALEYYRKSRALYEEIGAKEHVASLVRNIGNVERRRGAYAKALEAYAQSLALSEAIGHRRGAAETLGSMGDCQLLLGQPERALQSYRRSLKLSEDVGSKNGVARAMAGLGRVEQARDNHTAALALAKQAAALLEKTGALEPLWEVNELIGRSNLALRQTAQARHAFEQAVAAIETMRAQAAGGEMSRRFFLERRLSPYHSMIGLLVSQRQTEEALAWAERLKARVLLDALQSGRVELRHVMTTDEQQRERELRSELVSLNSQLTRATQSDKAAPARVSELKAGLDKARLSYEAFQTSLYASRPELKTQRGQAPVIKAEELSALLPTGASALLEYVVTDNVTYLFVVTKAADNRPETRVFTLPVKRAALAEQIESFRRRLAMRDLGFRHQAGKLYGLLLKPAQAQLKGKTNLVIAPDDMLWDLPFQALLTGARRFLIEDAAIAYAPSLTVLREMTKPRKIRDIESVSGTLLAFGNPLLGNETIERATLSLRDEKLTPLPEAEQEVKELGRLYSSARSRIYVGAEAREDRAKAESGKARILHFATHGTLNNAAPMYSHLVLAPGDNNEDGLLEAWELMQMDLHADLAVLSACETARGRFGAGEGVIGLTWALFVAGAPSTVVSQWKVESASTRDLMLSFHRRTQTSLSATKSKATKAEALRQAALKLMKNPATRHPFYWAGFVLVGDGR